MTKEEIHEARVALERLWKLAHPPHTEVMGQMLPCCPRQAEAAELWLQLDDFLLALPLDKP